MGDPRVQERSNPLVDKLNRIAALNRELGTPLGMAGGDSSPPSPGVVEGGRATVLPPPARPVVDPVPDATAAELEELERDWASDPSNPANRLEAQQVVAAGGAWVPPSMRGGAQQPLYRTDLKFGIDLENNTIAVNGATLPLTKAEAREFKKQALKVAERALKALAKQQLEGMRAAFAPPKKGAASEQPATVPTVPTGEGEGPVQSPTTAVPAVRKPQRRKARKRRALPRNVASKSPTTASEGSQST